MAAPTTNQIADALLARYPKSFAEELGIDVERNTPSQLFRLLCMSLLFSARISADIARRTAGALTAEGWTTAQSMADADWQRRTDVLNESGYARFDERTSTMLGETAEMALEDYRGDLRELDAPPSVTPVGSERCYAASRASATSASTSSSGRSRWRGRRSRPSPIRARSTPPRRSASATTRRRWHSS